MDGFRFPKKFIEFNVEKCLTNLDFEKVKKGSRPKHMDDKWVIYYQSPWVYFHRALTGNCIYKVHLVYGKNTIFGLNGYPDKALQPKPLYEKTDGGAMLPAGFQSCFGAGDH